MSNDGSVAPKERINIKYVPPTGDVSEEVELPLSMVVIGDFSAKADETPIEDRTLVNIDKDNFNDVLAGYSPNIIVKVEDRLSKEDAHPMTVDLTFNSIQDFSPESIAESVPELKSLLDLREALVALKGPLGNVPAFRKKIASILQDEDSRKLLLEELNVDKTEEG
ncbi:type VI secretion system contractile sheath small subunit [Moritella sp. 5]|uniref:type VI secretion system contractile sheath small subunit n=1 Tax=Moritella sp. 5 TaxID=2746231 RepID=UPI001BA5E77B|nr:type VI secretion system contractile sheath small subunit [Moritella sp. 5]QUM80159.1 type VI secretion system contractile sheath small subunit [Moritella sp. 5]